VKQFKKTAFKKGALAMSLATASLLTMGTLGGTLGAALADTSNQGAPQAAGERRGVFGSLTAKGTNTLTLLGRGGETLVLTVNDQTKYQIPGDDNPSFEDLASGHRLAALVQREAGGLVALQVMHVPGQPQQEHRVLTVVDIAGKTLTAQDAQGNKVTVELDTEVRPELRGQLTTFIGERSQQSNRFKANAEVKIEQVVERLEAHTTRLQEQAGAETDEAARTRKEHEATKIMDLLEVNRQRHLDRLDMVIARAPEQARISLEQARAQFEAQQAEARARFEAQQEQARAQFKEHYEARLRALENPMGLPEDKPLGGPMLRPEDKPLGGPILRPEDKPLGGPMGLPDQITNANWSVVTGTLMSVELRSGEITVGTREGSVQTVRAGPRSPDQVLGALKQMDSLLPGTQVVIKYRMYGGEVVELTFGRLDAIEPKPMPVVTQPATDLKADQEISRAKFLEEQAQYARVFHDQQAQALKRFQADQEIAHARFLEDQKLALARFQEQTKDVRAIAQFQEDQKLALVKFLGDQGQAHARFLEDQKLALMKFLGQQ
jgi:hypothetical protein